MTWLVLFLIVIAILAVLPFFLERSRIPVNDALRAQAPGEFVQLSDGMTHYQWLGQARGPVVVCVHGLTTPSQVWYGMAQGLARLGFRVLIYDLYGRGYSDRPAVSHSRRFYTRQLEELLDSQELRGEITLLGYSMGGQIATAFAAEMPARISRLILLAPSGVQHNAGKLAMAATRLGMLGDWLMLAIGGWNLRRKAYEGERASTVEGIGAIQREETRRQGYLPAVLSSQRVFLQRSSEADHRAIAATDIPVLAVWGKQDSVIPVSAMGILAQWNRRAWQEVLDDAGHELVFTHTSEILEAIGERVSYH